MSEERKLGKKAVKYDRRTLAIPRYLEKRKLPVIPKTHGLSRRTLKAFPDLGMMNNDNYGCCTVAGLAHSEQTWSTFGGQPRRPTDAEILAAYNMINGGRDEGAAMLDALKMARNIGIGGNKIYAFASINPTNHDQFRTGHFLFGGVYLGANLSVSAAQIPGELWDVGDGPEYAPGSWGGHAMNVVDYSPKGITVVTWGALQKATWAWVDRYCDEAYVIIEEDYAGDDRRSPQGFSLSKLAADLRVL